MYASLGCGALSAKCTAEPNIGYFCFLGHDTRFCRNPFAKTPFSWLLNQVRLLNIFGAGKGAVPHTLGKHFANLGARSRYASLDLFWGILGASGWGERPGGAWYGTSAKPEGHPAKGMENPESTPTFSWLDTWDKW